MSFTNWSTISRDITGTAACLAASWLCGDQTETLLTLLLHHNHHRSGSGIRQGGFLRQSLGKSLGDMSPAMTGSAPPLTMGWWYSRSQWLYLDDILEHLEQNGPVIILTNANLLTCSQCSNFSSCYQFCFSSKVSYQESLICVILSSFLISIICIG